MIKVMFGAKRRTGMPSGEFTDYWLTTHADLMLKVPGLQRYVISLPAEVNELRVPAFDGFAEVAYQDADAMRAAMATSAAQAMLADERNLFDVSASVREVVTEHVLLR